MPDLPHLLAARPRARILASALLFAVSAAIPAAPRTAGAAPEYRTIDGTGNNPGDPLMGAAGTQLLRITTVGYDDGISVPGGAGRPGTREISNILCEQPGSIPNSHDVSDFVWQWGQFLDHDLDLTRPADPADPANMFNIPVPPGDPYFDVDGTQIIRLIRSVYDPATGTGVNNPREQLNQITAFIDASNVYGSDAVRAAALRTNGGRLKTSEGDLLPFNLDGLPNEGGTDSSLFLAGDVRANEQVGLTAMHTLFVREHNRLAGIMKSSKPHPSDDETYQMARRIVGALIQTITYNEFLPALLGPNALEPYAGYQPAVDAGISNIFSTASYRFGHSMLSSTLLRLRKNGKPIEQGHLPLRDAFFAPWRITEEGGIDPLLRGLAKQRPQEVDVKIVDDVRNFLFGPPIPSGLDLAALNMQRGRDHGLPDYNQVRIDMGLEPAVSFADITSDVAVQQKLEAVYGNVNNVDAWMGGLAEDHLPGALVGELVFTVLKDQFERLRDGDRFWYENIFSGPMQKWLSRNRLSHVIRRNTGIRGELRKNVFILETGRHSHEEPHSH